MSLCFKYFNELNTRYFGVGELAVFCSVTAVSRNCITNLQQKITSPGTWCRSGRPALCRLWLVGVFETRSSPTAVRENRVLLPPGS